MSYSIILPAYKEAKNLDIIIDQIQNFMKGEIFEIIVVDDFSDDGTEQILKRKPKFSDLKKYLFILINVKS